MAANDLTFFDSSVSTVDGNVSINTQYVDIDENVILAQLNELRQWQESQQKSLAENQLSQQKMLELEKQKLYALFGLSANESSLNVKDGGACSSESSYFIPSAPIMNVHNAIETPTRSIYSGDCPIDEKPLEIHSPSMHQLQKIIENMAIRSPRQNKSSDEAIVDIPKRPFLKRGEGLKSRFKISPDAFRLDNLPKYKYAQRMQKHAQTTKSRKQRHQKNTTNDTKASTARVGVGVTSEGHQNNANEKCTQSKQQSENKSEPLNLKSKRPNPKRPSPNQLKLKPIAVQQSQPLKSSSNILNQFSHQDVLGSERPEHGILSKTKLNPLSPATKVLLDTPTRERVQFQQDEINELKRFVQLEEDLNKENSVLDMAGSKRDENLVLKFKVAMNVSPKHSRRRNIDDIEEEDEEEDEENLQRSLSSESSIGDESKHVRFTSKVPVIDRNRAAIEANDENIYDVPKTSSPYYDRSTESFKVFKDRLFQCRLNQNFQNRLSVAKDFEISDFNSNKSDCGDDDATATELNETNGESAKDKLQLRLLSLEHEIHSFRQQNNELTKLIREHEMIRLTFDEERREYEKHMENERIHFEMYMHDQRLNMLNEKAKWEKKTKDCRGMTQTEKNELNSLREKCANHDIELSAREQKHVAAQGRIRAQLRNVEKDLKEARLELENLQRENKKLESENMRLRRQSNSKILTEINKSISKIANHSNEYTVHDNQHENAKDGVKEKSVVRPAVKKCSNKNAHKTVVAKVTSRDEPIKGNHMRSKSAPNLQQTESNEASYELCSSNASDGENSECSTPDGNRHGQSSYFSTHSSQKDRSRSTDDNNELGKNASNQCDESDNNVSCGTTKRIIENPDGSKDIWYANGNLKKISADGMCIRMLYFNKDIKETDIKEGIVKYYYAETDTWQTSYLDGLEIFEYPGGQTEHRYKNGTVEVHFPNRSVRITNPAREQKEGIKEEWKYADGSNAVQLTNGERILMLPNGQREIHANGHKRREYPDGTVKIVYPDGSQETRYSNGRVRLKNKDGKLIMDSETISI